MKSKLVRFEFDMAPLKVSAAWGYCNQLSAARGLPAPPTRYRRNGLSVRLHPDDVQAAKTFCEQLNRQQQEPTQ